MRDYVDKIIFSHKSIGTWRTERMPRQARLDAPGTLHHVIVKRLRRGGSRISLVQGRSSDGGFHLCCFQDDPEK